MNKNFTDGMLLRIFIGEADLLDGVPLFDKVLELVSQTGLMGATVLRGIEGVGQRRETHTAKILRLLENLPVVVEVIDEPSKIESLLKAVDEIFEKAGCGGFVTTEKVAMKRYKDTSG